MENIFTRMRQVIEHLEIYHKVFMDSNNFPNRERFDYNVYSSNEEKFREYLDRLNFDNQIYSSKERQMILADFIEYIFLGRGYYSIRTQDNKSDFIRTILYFVNLLMCYEVITVSDNLRRKILEELGDKIRMVREERYYNELKNFSGKVGPPENKTDAPGYLNRYFDSILPKTAGGLWHELLVYVFLLRNNLGYIVPLLLSQRLISLDDSIIPPDFLVITHDKRIYGIEVGMKKEIQSGSFSLRTAIPTATIDTINSRASDRCPICKRWIPFCDFVINRYSDLNIGITKAEIKCLDECNIYSKDEISNGRCLYTKYSRGRAQSMEYTHHKYANGLHYHYKCVLENVSNDMKSKIIEAKDRVALKAHYPYYSGVEELMRR